MKKVAFIPKEFFQVILCNLIFRQSEQAVLVKALPKATVAELFYLEKRFGRWVSSKPIPANVGKNGISPWDEKYEGDGMTPAGIFPVWRAFGADASIETKLNYTQRTSDACWVEDQKNEHYNKLMFKWPGKPSDISIREKDLQNVYKYAAVIEHNTDPIVRGRGSATFLHVWRSPGKPTAGCIAIEENLMRETLAWFDSVKKPLIIIIRNVGG